MENSNLMGHKFRTHLEKGNSKEECNIDSTELLDEEKPEQHNHWLVSGGLNEASPFRILESFALHWCEIGLGAISHVASETDFLFALQAT